MEDKNIGRIILLLILVAIIFLLPVPYYQQKGVVCKMGQTCPKPGWHTTGKSLFQFLLYLMTNTSQTRSVIKDSPNRDFQCPSNGWVGCMPILSEEGKRACSAEAMSWYKANCPGFKGAAL